VFYNWKGENQGTFADENLQIFAELNELGMNQFDECMSTNRYLSKVEADFKDGEAAGVNSTPTLFLNGVNIGGLKEYSYYRVRLEEALAEVGG